MDRTVRVSLGSRSYTIHIGQGALDAAGDLIKSHVEPSRAFVVTDENVAPLYLSRLVHSLEGGGFDVESVTVPAGEASKSLSVVADLYDRLASLRFRRDELIVGLGGGVVGDLAGFVASTWLRGVPFVQVPTTVLAQVDSSVGGKVGVNHPQGKNLIGSFYQPLLVVIDPSVLATLPEREVWAGLAEVVKYGFIADERLFSELESSLQRLVANPLAEQWIGILARCCSIKAQVVEQDEHDLGFRHVLNFGHTVGHALEAATGYQRYRHGEAVVIGMRAALWLSHWNSGLTEEALQRGLAALDQFPVGAPSDLSAEQLIPYLATDKKRTAVGQKWVLLQRIGQAAIASGLPDDSVLRAIKNVLR